MNVYCLCADLVIAWHWFFIRDSRIDLLSLFQDSLFCPYCLLPQFFHRCYTSYATGIRNDSFCRIPLLFFTSTLYIVSNLRYCSLSCGCYVLSSSLTLQGVQCLRRNTECWSYVTYKSDIAYKAVRALMYKFMSFQLSTSHVLTVKMLSPSFTYEKHVWSLFLIR